VNATERTIIEAVRDGKVDRRLQLLATRYLEQKSRPAPAPRPPAPAKAPVASLEHWEASKKAADREADQVGVAVWTQVLLRSATDHRGTPGCEACHRRAGYLEPHHLELGAAGRPDEIHLVMALCSSCHRLAPDSAHRAPRGFALRVVIPWAQAHGYALPNRKEYRTP
jgi:hypothetical protein